MRTPLCNVDHDSTIYVAVLR